MQDRFRSMLVSSWAMLGVVLLLVESVVRLARVALAGISEGLRPHEWGALVACSLVMGYVEGYRAFARSFGPRVVERAFELGRRGSTLHALLAPAYAMSLIGDTRRRIVQSWLLALGIVALIVLVRRLPPTWRAIADASVALSLSWGIVVICSLWATRLRRELSASAPPVSTRSPSRPPPSPARS